MHIWWKSKQVLYSKSRSCAIAVAREGLEAIHVGRPDLPMGAAVIVVVSLYAALAEEPRIVAIVNLLPGAYMNRRLTSLFSTSQSSPFRRKPYSL